MERTQQKWNLKISKTKAYRSRSLAFDLVDESFREQYTRFYDYCHELIRSNRGSTVIVITTPFQGGEDDLEHPEMKKKIQKNNIMMR
jgi:aromatic ring hydroxylase